MKNAGYFTKLRINVLTNEIDNELFAIIHQSSRHTDSTVGESPNK